MYYQTSTAVTVPHWRLKKASQWIVTWNYSTVLALIVWQCVTGPYVKSSDVLIATQQHVNCNYSSAFGEIFRSVDKFHSQNFLLFSLPSSSISCKLQEITTSRLICVLLQQIGISRLACELLQLLHRQPSVDLHVRCYNRHTEVHYIYTRHTLQYLTWFFWISTIHFKNSCYGLWSYYH